MSNHSRPGRLRGMDQEQLTALLDEVWRRQQDLQTAALFIYEELLSRLVSENVPGAAVVVLVEDASHDAPHGHLKWVKNEAGNVLVAAGGDDYHDLPWSHEADEHIYDLYSGSPGIFGTVRDGGETFTGYVFRVDGEPVGFAAGSGMVRVS